MTDLGPRRAQMEARSQLRRFGVENEAPVPIEDIAHALGVELISGGVGNALASLLRIGEQRRIRIGNQHDHPGQLRYSIAHELGHLVLRHHVGRSLCDHGSGSAQPADKAAEREADVFAAEMLLPERRVRKRCEVSPVSLDVVRAIATDYEMSTVATSIRFAELTSERCAVVLSQDNRVRWAVRSETFWPEIARGRPLSPWSLAHDYFAKGEVAGDPGRVEAHAWIEATRLRGEADIVEHALAIPPQRAVLSLLWIPETSRALAYRSI